MKNLLPCEETMMHKLLAQLSTSDLLAVMYGQLAARNEKVLCDDILILIAKEVRLRNAD